MSLRPQLDAIRREMNALREEAVPKLKGLSDNQLNWTPGGDKWSIALILDHLNKGHELVLPRFNEALSSAKPSTDKREAKFGFMDRIFLRMMDPNLPITVPVPPMFAPTEAPNPSRTVVPKFFMLHDALANAIDRADEFELNGVRVTSPVSAKFRPNIVAYFQGLSMHEWYHWGQIRTLLKDDSFPKR